MTTQLLREIIVARTARARRILTMAPTSLDWRGDHNLPSARVSRFVMNESSPLELEEGHTVPEADITSRTSPERVPLRRQGAAGVRLPWPRGSGISARHRAQQSATSPRIAPRESRGTRRAG